MPYQAQPPQLGPLFSLMLQQQNRRRQEQLRAQERQQAIAIRQQERAQDLGVRLGLAGIGDSDLARTVRAQKEQEQARKSSLQEGRQKGKEGRAQQRKRVQETGKLLGSVKAGATPAEALSAARALEDLLNRPESQANLMGVQSDVALEQRAARQEARVKQREQLLTESLIRGRKQPSTSRDMVNEAVAELKLKLLRGEQLNPNEQRILDGADEMAPVRRKQAAILLKVSKGENLKPEERNFLNEVKSLDPTQRILNSFFANKGFDFSAPSTESSVSGQDQIDALIEGFKKAHNGRAPTDATELKTWASGIGQQ